MVDITIDFQKTVQSPKHKPLVPESPEEEDVGMFLSRFETDMLRHWKKHSFEFGTLWCT